MISFSHQVKDEVSKLEIEKISAISELSAIIQNIGSIDKNIKITIENASVARRIFNLLKITFDIIPKITVRKGYNFNKNLIYILEFADNKHKVLNTIGIYNNLIPEEYIVSDIEQKRAYLRGVFLSIGSINDPKKSRYHLEFLVNNIEYSKFLSDLLNEFRLNSKVIKRDHKYMVYVKEAEKIGDFLRILNAYNAVFYFEDIRIYRDHKNMTNRLNNCEQANIDKIILTANNQVNQIEVLKKYDVFDLLTEKEKVAAEYRLKYPDVSLLELSEIISLETNTPITKSGLHHRFNKIKTLYEKIEEKNNSKK